MNEIFLFKSEDFPGILGVVNVISLREERGLKESPSICFIWQNWNAGLWTEKKSVWENAGKYYREEVSFVCNMRYWSLFLNEGSKSLILKKMWALTNSRQYAAIGKVSIAH